MLLFFLIIILLDLPEFSLLSIKSAKNKSRLLAAEIVENCLWNDLTHLNKVKAGLTKLAD
jgi:hypothetical protein